MKKISDEVYYLDDNKFSVSRNDISLLKEIALNNDSNKARLCTHFNTEEIIHEMFIVHTNKVIVKPHKHINSVESFHIIEGTIILSTFSQTGILENEEELSTTNHLSSIYFKIPKDTYHSIKIVSPVAIFKETKQGPFLAEDSTFPDWSA